MPTKKKKSTSSKSVKKDNSSLSYQKAKKMIDRFYQVVGDLRTGEEAKTFLLDFLTKSERATFAKRLSVAIALDEGKSYEEIRKLYGVSSATISSVAEMMISKGMQLAIKKFQTDQWADNWAEKILKKIKAT